MSVDMYPPKISGMQMAFVAGLVSRADAPLTRAVKLYPLEAPKTVPVASVKAVATRPSSFGMVQMSKFPKQFAGMDAAGFMT